MATHERMVLDPSIMTFTLAHLSDPHLAPLPRARFTDLASKRVLGYLNWHRGRHEVHRADVLLALTDDMAAQRPDHVAVTGDLVNIALDAEFEASASWLDRLGTPERVSVVPGNHDAYVRGALERAGFHWAGYMDGDSRGASAARALADLFPFARRRGPLFLLGLSTAVVTGPFLATGKLGGTQMVKAADALDHAGREGLCRVVLMHHPPLHERAYSAKRLVDAGAFRTMLAAAGAELVLCGHLHVEQRAILSGPHGGIPMIGVPSASADPIRARHAAGYALHRIEAEKHGWSITVVRRRFTAPGRIETISAETFRVGRASS